MGSSWTLNFQRLCGVLTSFIRWWCRSRDCPFSRCCRDTEECLQRQKTSVVPLSYCLSFSVLSGRVVLGFERSSSVSWFTVLGGWREGGAVGMLARSNHGNSSSLQHFCKTAFTVYHTHSETHWRPLENIDIHYTYFHKYI